MVELTDSELLNTKGFSDNSTGADVILHLNEDGETHTETKTKFEEDPIIEIPVENSETTEKDPEPEAKKAPKSEFDVFLEEDSPEEEAETEEEPEEAPEIDEKPAPKRKRGAQDRIRELSAKNHELNSRLAQLEQQIAQAMNAPQQNVQQNAQEPLTDDVYAAIPDPSQYLHGSSDTNYIADLVAYHTQVQLQQNEAIAAERQRQLQEENARNEYIDSINQKLMTQTDRGREIYSDFDDVVFNDNNRLDFNTLAILMDMDNGAELTYRILKNPEHAARLMDMPVIQQMREIVRLDNAISDVKVKAKISKAPPPIKSFKASASGVNAIRADTTSLADFEKIFYKK